MVAAVSIPEEDPIPTPSCPWHASTSCVEPATGHEYDRTGMRWWCGSKRALFRGTQSEFQHTQARVIADRAEAQASSPNPEDHR